MSQETSPLGTKSRSLRRASLCPGTGQVSLGRLDAAVRCRRHPAVVGPATVSRDWFRLVADEKVLISFRSTVPKLAGGDGLERSRVVGHPILYGGNGRVGRQRLRKQWLRGSMLGECVFLPPHLGRVEAASIAPRPTDSTASSSVTLPGSGPRCAPHGAATCQR